MSLNSLLLPLAVVLFSSIRTNATNCTDQTTSTCHANFGFNVTVCPATVDSSCTVISTNCSTSLSSNYSYVVACSSNKLKFYRSDNVCATSNSATIDTTDTFCAQSSKYGFGNCSLVNGQWILSASVANSVARRLLNCSSTTPAPTQRPLVPNPVGPDAITAIVVLVCLAITAVLAGFFFWPKCHIADPAAHALKMATKPSTAKTAAAARPAPPPATDSTARVVYQPDRKTATITLPSVPGPSAA